MANEIKATLRGRLGGDVEVNLTRSGQEVAEFDVAVTVRRKDEAGQWQDVRTDWVRVAAWGHLIGAVMQLRKGTLVEVSGRLSANAYLRNVGKARLEVGQPLEPGDLAVGLRVSADAVTIVPLAPKPPADAPVPDEGWAPAPAVPATTADASAGLIAAPAGAPF